MDRKKLSSDHDCHNRSEKVDLEEFKMKTGKKPHKWNRVFFMGPG